MQLDETEFVVPMNFDELETENCCLVSLRTLRGTRRPRPGEWIQLRDKHDGACMACVKDVDGWDARVEPDWNTWSGATVPRMARESWRRLNAIT
jgi:hypothetical protein